MAKTRFISNLVGGSTASSLVKLGQGITVNMFEETTESSDTWVNKILRPIPGYKKVVDIEGSCRGMYTVSNGYNKKPCTYAVFGSKLYMIVKYMGQWRVSTIGTLGAGTTPVHFCETGNRDGFHSHLVIVDGFYCYAVDTQIAPANQREDFCIIQTPFTDHEQGITIKPTHVAYLYGYVVVNDKNSDNFYVSYQFPFERNGSDNKVDKNIFQVGSEEWGYGGQSLQAYWAPDNTTALVANGSRLYTFGDRSYQVWQYANDLNIPFNSPDTAAAYIGLKAINSLCQLGSAVAFLGSSDLGNNGVYVIQGGSTATRVSTPEIEREIASYKNIKDAIGQIWQSEQHIFYCITFPSADKTWCYDLTEQSWSNRSSMDSANVQRAWRYNYATMNGEGKIWQAFTGGIAEQSDDWWLEHDDNPILRLRRGGVIASTETMFYMDSIELMTDNGQYKYLPDTECKMMMRFSTDGTSWSDHEVVEIGSVGEYGYDTVFYDFGMARIFIIELSCTDNVPFALYGMKIKAEECGW